jgi:hypothetical protein
MELVKALVFLTIGVARSPNVVAFIFSTVSIPRRPKVMGPYPLPYRQIRASLTATVPEDVLVKEV